MPFHNRPPQAERDNWGACNHHHQTKKMTTTLENLQQIALALQASPIEELQKFESFELGHEWLPFLKSGIKARQILALQNVTEGITLKELGKRIGVTPERVRQSKLTALRRLGHPARKRLAKLMPPKLHLEVYGKMPETA